MSGRNKMHDIYGQQLQKQLDEDFVEFVKEEQKRDYPTKQVMKLEPAYIHNDVFKDQREEQLLRSQKREDQNQPRYTGLIQPDE